jgi:hypothetical protein
MAVILQFLLCLYKLQRLMISVDHYLLPKNIIISLASGMYNGIHFFFIGGEITYGI